MKKIKLLIIEDNKLLRNGIIAMLKNQKDIDIFTTSGNNKKTIYNILQLKPNIILLDLGLHNRNSLAVIKFVKKDFPKAKVIIMDIAPVPGDINLFIKAGASGFILKDATFDEFLSTIHTVAEGTKVLFPDLNESLFTQIVEHALKGDRKKLKEAVRMTMREREVIGLIGDGLNNKEIAQKLNISTFTVKSHIHNIMEKFTLHTRLEIANYSYSAKTLKNIIHDISKTN
ncbi:MAG: response regulator transcription factor [Ignavibacteriaceae bacterium]